MGKKKGFCRCLYRSSSQTSNEFKDYCMEFNLHLSDINDLNPAYSFIIGDFNTRSSLWWELDKENNEG